MKAQKNRTAIYCRLSRDDGEGGDSVSIATQKQMLKQYAKEREWPIVCEYVDDGYSGTNFDRPDFNRLQQDILAEKIDILLTKDLSRLGRDYLQTGLLTEIFFPQNNVRYIAMDDGVDTSKNDNEIIPFKNILNEFYAKDSSKKVRSAYRQKAINGEFTASFAPYGYEKSKADKHKLVIDELAAQIIHKIFNEATSGKGTYQIAEQLKKEKILTPRAYTAEKYSRYKTAFNIKYPYDWSNTTITSIIKNRVYLGHMVNNKSTTASFKCKKLISIPETDWIEVKNTHEPIISEDQFELAQQAVKVKRRPTKDGDRQIFSGLLKCSTCGRLLAYARQKDRKDGGNFACSLSRRKGKEYCSFHYISYDAIYKLLLNDLQHQTAFMRENKEYYIERIKVKLALSTKNQLASINKEKNKLQSRIGRLNEIFKNLYEDRVFERVTEEQYFRLVDQFEIEEQNALERINNFNEVLKREMEQRNNIDDFIEIIEKYIDAKELTQSLLNELVDQLIVYDAETVDGERVQRVDIYYRFLGKI